jgi:hypothetical protein
VTPDPQPAPQPNPEPLWESPNAAAAVEIEDVDSPDAELPVTGIASSAASCETVVVTATDTGFEPGVGIVAGLPTSEGANAAVGDVCPISEPTGKTGGAGSDDPIEPANDCEAGGWKAEAAERELETGLTTAVTGAITGASTRAGACVIGVSTPLTGASALVTGASTPVTAPVTGDRTRPTSRATGATTLATGATMFATGSTT